MGCCFSLKSKKNLPVGEAEASPTAAPTKVSTPDTVPSEVSSPVNPPKPKSRLDKMAFSVLNQKTKTREETQKETATALLAKLAFHGAILTRLFLLKDKIHFLL